jgi:hypothetical protein
LNNLSEFEKELCTILERIGYTIGGLGDEGVYVKVANFDEITNKLFDIEISLDNIATSLSDIAESLKKEAKS